jgi:RecA/RadA recombinase
MPRTLPEKPRIAPSSERRVYQTLLDQLQDEDLIIPGQRVTDHSKDHEIDFVVAIDGAGIVCVEVKGGEVWHDGDTWWQNRGEKPERIDPVRQVREACYALRDFVEGDSRWTKGRQRWNHVVVLPHCGLAEDFALPDCPRWKIIDRTELSHLGSRLRQVLLGQDSDRRPLLDHIGIDQLRTALGGRGLPQRDVVARALANDTVADALTEQQAVILGAIQLLNRVEVRGSAGSGKTFLAVEQARRLTAAGKRVALLCYSPGLASFLKRMTAVWPRRQRPAYVGGFHSLGMSWGAPSGPDELVASAEPTEFWERDLPRQMAELVHALPRKERFDAVVIDEAQDFADAWWDPVLAALRDAEAGGLFVFSDEGQRVFDRHGVPPVPLLSLLLDRNLRNTRQIANTFQPLVDYPIRFVGSDGPHVTFVACSPAEAIDTGDDQVEELFDDGWRPEDIALLTTGGLHPEQVARQAISNDSYWDSFWDLDQVFYGDVLGFKGLERRAVVLVVDGQRGLDRARERLYVGLSRARDRLIVCGDPDFIAKAGGPDLARRLKIAAGIGIWSAGTRD